MSTPSAAGLPAGFGVFEVSCEIAATPREIFEAFLHPERLARWFGPDGWSVPADSVEIMPAAGGRYRFLLVDDADPAQSSPVDATIEDIRAPHYLRHRDRAYTALGFPEDVVTETVLEETAAGTRLTVRQSPLPEAVFDPAAQGWRQSFASLERLLAENS